MTWLSPSHPLLHHRQEQIGVLLHHTDYLALILTSEQLLELRRRLVRHHALADVVAVILGAGHHQPQGAHRLVDGRLEAAQHRVPVDRAAGWIVVVVDRQALVQLHHVVRGSRELVRDRVAQLGGHCKNAMLLGRVRLVIPMV